MPAPDPHSLWIEGGQIVALRYYGTGGFQNREKRVERMADRMRRGTWCCKWCGDDLDMCRRVDAQYCGASCRRKAQRARQ